MLLYLKLTHEKETKLNIKDFLELKINKDKIKIKNHFLKDSSTVKKHNYKKSLRG